MSNVVKLRAETEVLYHMDNNKISGVSIERSLGDSKERRRIFIATPDDIPESDYCDIYIDNGNAAYKKEEIVELCIAWLALVKPEALKIEGVLNE